MKKIKVVKKEYIVIEKKELEGILADIKLYAKMVKRNTLEAKTNNYDFATGLSLEKIAAISESTTNYLFDLESELI